MIMKKYFLASAWAIAAALVFLGNIGFNSALFYSIV